MGEARRRRDRNAETIVRHWHILPDLDRVFIEHTSTCQVCKASSGPAELCSEAAKLYPRTLVAWSRGSRGGRS